jgi:ribonuclease III
MLRMANYSEGPLKMTDDRITALNNFQNIISYSFRDIGLLENALIHRSFVNENPAPLNKDNERLEFLGDAVLGLCISDILMKKFPDYTEGQLSKLRAFVVNEHSLADLARNLEIGVYLLLGRGEESSGGRTKSSILSNAFEAVIASVYLDSGFENAHKFVEAVFEPLIKEGIKTEIFRDYKTALQEICQNRFKAPPRYIQIREHGPDHDKIFEVSLSIADIITTTGKGKSKKEAEQQAARKAFKEIQQNENEMKNE